MAVLRSEDRFMQLYVQNQGRIYRYIMSLVLNPADAEELFQQTSLSLWQHRETFDPARGEFGPWAMTIALNHVRKHLRTKSRRPREIGLSPEAIERIAALHLTECELFETRRQALAACLERLPVRSRGVLQRYYESQLDIEQVGQEFGLTTAACYKALQRIRRALMECITAATAPEGRR
jgi:RNA polymerase sigma-70 factor (ECF subfamily)